MPVANSTTTVPALGVGLGYRSELRQGILANRERIDFLEIITDNYLRESSALAALEELCALFPVIPHVSWSRKYSSRITWRNSSNSSARHICQ
jgi:uncharacterized protein (UPF0276 family)